MTSPDARETTPLTVYFPGLITYIRNRTWTRKSAVRSAAAGSEIDCPTDCTRSTAGKKATPITKVHLDERGELPASRKGVRGSTAASYDQDTDDDQAPTKTLSPIQNPSVLLTTSINAATSAKRMAATSATRFLDSRLRPTVSGTAIPNNTIGREMLNNAWKGTIPPAQTQFTPAQCPW